MECVEGAIVQRMISKLMLTLLIESGVLDRHEAAEGIREAQRQIAQSGLAPRVRQQLVRELDKMLQAIEPVPARHTVN